MRRFTDLPVSNDRGLIDLLPRVQDSPHGSKSVLKQSQNYEGIALDSNATARGGYTKEGAVARYRL